MKTTYHIRKHQNSAPLNVEYDAISLPAIPGVTITSDRSDTKPHQPTIRTGIPRRAAVGAAVGAAARQQALARVAMFKAALIEAMGERT